MKDIVIVGAGGHARVVLDVIRQTGGFNVRGFIDTASRDGQNTMHEGLPIFTGDAAVEELRSEGVEYAVIAIGDNQARQTMAERLSKSDFTMATLVHPSAIIANGVAIGSGTVIFAGVIINPSTYIGDNVILNTAATIDHDCVIENCAHIAPGVHLAGHVRVGERALVGVGAAVKPNIRIGNDARVGVGAAVIHDVPRGVTVVGVPARVIE